MSSQFYISIGKCHECPYFHAPCIAQCKTYKDELWQTLTEKANNPNRVIWKGYCGTRSSYMFYVQEVSEDIVLPSREELIAEIVQFNIAHPELSGVSVYVQRSRK